MANNFDSNFTRKLARSFTDAFESERVLTKNVNTQFLSNAFNPATGDKVDIKRPTDFISNRTPTGDLSNKEQDIITGKATAEVQDYFSAVVDFDEADEAIKMDQLDQLLRPMAKRIVTDLELDFAEFMMLHSSLLAGTVGVAVSKWDHVAEAGSIMQSMGVPMDSPWNYAVNPFTQRNLASDQRSLGASDTLVKSANDRAMIAQNFAGMDVRTANSLASFTSDTVADRVGAINGNPVVTYLAAKDTMQQAIIVDAMGVDLEIRAGELVTVTGRFRVSGSTRKLILNDLGLPILWTGVVAENVTLSGTGTGTILVNGPAIFEAAGAYNTTATAIVDNDIITLLGAASTAKQPNLFWHKNAFALGSVPIKKLNSTDTLATTEDGLQIRVSKGTDFLKNKQIVRFDFRPAFGSLNPFMAGHGFGRS